MYGYGRFLRINVTNKTYKIEEIPADWLLMYGGGRGFGIKILYDELPDNCDALGEENKVILCTGVLAGTPIQAVHRWICITKSPLTNGYCRSVGGGTFAAYMRFAGYDCLIIEGKSDKPVYLHITSDGCTFHDASEIWGKNTEEAQDYVVEKLGGKNISTVAIGPAGENGVLYAGVFCGRRSASRCGGGTVLGSKKVKVIAIEAKRSLNLYDPDKVKLLAKEQLEIMRGNRDFQLHREFGTTDGMLSRNTMGVFPTKNFRYGYMHGWEAMSGAEYKKLRIGEAGCYSCSARCGKIHKVTEGPYAGALSEGPEYESYWAMSGTIDSNNIAATILADQLCDDYGLDTISTGVTIGFAYELYEKGIITKEDTDGLELEYGNHQAMIQLIHKIARREGFGDILALGTKRMAEKYGQGTDHYAMHVKGLELAGYEPRALKATGYAYSTSNIGGAHGAGALAFQEWGMPVPRAVDRFDDFGKADIVIFNQNNSCSNEIGVICSFALPWGWNVALYGPMLTAVTGLEEFSDRKFLWQLGERIFNLERAFLNRQGISRKDDALPKRVQTEPLHTCGMPGEGQMIRHHREFLDEYYKLRGWDENGVPTKEKLEELKLGYVVKDLERARSKNLI